MTGYLRSTLVLRPPVGFRELKDLSVERPWGTVVLAGRAFQSVDGGLRLIASEDEIQGKRWLHVSVSRASRMPSYEDLVRVKNEFIGDDVPAYQVFPRREEHRNLHNFCLHLWCPLDGDPFPDPLGERADTIAPRGAR